MSLARRNVDTSQHPTLMSLLCDLPPELFEMAWSCVLQHSEQPVKLKEHSIISPHDNVPGLNPRTKRNVIDATCPMDDLVAQIIAAPTRHRAGQELLDKARAEFFKHNTFHIYGNAISRKAVDWPWVRAFRQKYAAQIESLNLELVFYMHGSTHDTPTCVHKTDPCDENGGMAITACGSVTHALIARIGQALRSFKSPSAAARALKLPKLKHLTITIANTRHEPHWPRQHTDQRQVGDRLGNTCALFCPCRGLLPALRRDIEPKLTKLGMEWIRIEWLVDCEHESCAMRNAKKLATVSAVEGFEREGFEREGDLCSMLILPRLTVEERQKRALKCAHGTKAAPARKSAMQALMTKHFAVLSEVVGKGGKKGCR